MSSRLELKVLQNGGINIEKFIGIGVIGLALNLRAYDFVSQGIKGRMFNSSGFQIDAIYLPGQSSEKIAVFAESAEEVNGGMYHCITTFDFSEEKE